MMVISFHDKLARPARVRIVEAFIARVQTQKGVWFARKDELARFVLDSPADPRDGSDVAQIPLRWSISVPLAMPKRR